MTMKPTDALIKDCPINDSGKCTGARCMFWTPDRMLPEIGDCAIKSIAVSLQKQTGA